jgi:hypothetical protein
MKRDKRRLPVVDLLHLSFPRHVDQLNANNDGSGRINA